MKNWLQTRKEQGLGKYRALIREKAIKQAKVEIALAGRTVEDYTEAQLEIIVKDQEDKLIAKYRNSGVVVLLLLLGIT